MKGGDKMDLVNVLSTGALMANVSSSSSSSSTSQTAGKMNFANQLVKIVNAGQAEGTTAIEEEDSSLLTQLLSRMKLLSSNELTTDELDQAIEGVLDQLDELKEIDLSEEQLSGLEQILSQLIALVQAVSIQTDQLVESNDNFMLMEQVSLHNKDQVSTNVITKLQDQLLVLQQALQDGSLKVIQGKQPESFIAEQLQQVEQAIEKLLNEKTSQLQENKSAQQLSQSFIEVKSANDSLAHLQKLAQQYNTVTATQSQTENTPVQTEEQPAEQPFNAVTLLRADNVKDFLPQLDRTSTATSSAFVLANEFADTMEGLIVHKFDVTALNGVTEARLMLTPDSLGHVDVKISMQNGVLTAMFQAETAMGKDAIENQMAALRVSLAAQGITVEKIEVSQASFSAQLSHQQKQNQQQPLKDENQHSRKDGENSVEEEILANVSHRELGYGRAVNAMV